MQIDAHRQKEMAVAYWQSPTGLLMVPKYSSPSLQVEQSALVRDLGGKLLCHHSYTPLVFKFHCICCNIDLGSKHTTIGYTSTDMPEFKQQRF